MSGTPGTGRTRSWSCTALTQSTAGCSHPEQCPRTRRTLAHGGGGWGVGGGAAQAQGGSAGEGQGAGAGRHKDALTPISVNFL